MDTLLEVGVVIQVEAIEPEEVARLVQQLLVELSTSDSASVTLMRTPVTQPGAKRVDIAEIGGLLLSLLPKVLPSVVDLIKGWTARHGEKHAITVTITDKDSVIKVTCSPGTSVSITIGAAAS